jgi:signal transduction histidine kinase
MDGFQSATLPDGRWLRITHAAVSFDQGVALPPWLHAHGDASHRPEALRHVDIFLANDISRVHHDLLVLAGILAALWLVATVLSALASVYLRRAILRPIARISQIISDIGPDNLKARVASAQVPDEMHGIIDRLNGLVGRLDEAFMRERSTIANIAHELRTPVTGLSATLEFALARGAHASRDQDLRACLAMTVAMQRMIANLLTLARLESGAVAVIPTPVDAAEIMRTCLGVVQERVAEGGYRISEAISDTVRVMAGEEPLRMILGNVLDNALSYADPARPIRVSVSAVGSHAHIQVINGTDGTLTDVSQVFTPFWRGDQVRRSGQHCGLGLSLVQRQLTVFAGTVQVHLGAGHEFIVEMRVPLAATPG